jgi:hypothetical protein
VAPEYGAVESFQSAMNRVTEAGGIGAVEQEAENAPCRRNTA